MYPCLLHTVNEVGKHVNIFINQLITQKIQFASKCIDFIWKEQDVGISPLHRCVQRIQPVENVHKVWQLR